MPLRVIEGRVPPFAALRLAGGAAEGHMGIGGTRIARVNH